MSWRALRSSDTPVSIVEDAFNNISSRDDIGIILINQHVSERPASIPPPRVLLTGYAATQ